MFNRYAIAGLLIFTILASVVAWIWYPWVFSPHYTIRVATGPIGSDGQQFIAAFKRQLTQERPRVRLALEETRSLDESAEAFLSGKFDLAASRSDHPAAANGATIVILKRLALVVMVPAHSSAKSMKDLAGKKLAVLDSTPNDDLLLNTVTRFYGIKAADVIKSQLADIGGLFKSKEVVGLIAMGTTGPGAIADAVKAIAKSNGRPPKFIDLEAKEIAEQNPVYEELEIPKSAFLASPATPDDDVTTIAMTIRLIAKKPMLNDVASELTRLLLDTRAKLVLTVPSAARIEAPDTDKKSVLPVHPGTAAFLDGTQDSFFDQVMTQLFNFSVIGGMLGSAALAIGTFWRKHHIDDTKKRLARLPVMLREAKSAPVDQLKDLEEELDGISGDLLARFVEEEIAPERIGGVSALISHIRLVIKQRRRLVA